MALRHIVYEGDEILTKKCRPVENFDRKLTELLKDMKETMIHNQGIGLAAPQVGMLKRVCVIGPFEEDDYYEMVNPVIVSSEGEQEGYEGCLSVPGYVGCVKRPEKVVIKAQDRNGEEVEFTLEGFPAVAACHEIDHLDGILYTSKATDIHKPEDRPEDYEDPEE
ncbi:MAG: peptide deformylase [Eubacteriaceae bacterium]|jgi:peptide deformylase|nr:peptide deformylase [Eubacteriaceae bacterium]